MIRVRGMSYSILPTHSLVDFVPNGCYWHLAKHVFSVYLLVYSSDRTFDAFSNFARHVRCLEEATLGIFCTYAKRLRCLKDCESRGFDFYFSTICTS